jgi:multicomponent Na+:H+ antiporter subunit D
MAAVGIPLFNIFWSKLRIILATIGAGYTWAAFLVLGASVVEAVYYFRLIHAIWFEGEGEKVHESAPIIAIIVALAILIVAIGIYPNYIWSVSQKAGSDIFNVAQYIKNVPLMGVGA